MTTRRAAPESVAMVREWAAEFAELMAMCDLESVAISFKSPEGPLRLIHTETGGAVVLPPGEKAMALEAWLEDQTA
jgi:hypothetical protein